MYDVLYASVTIRLRVPGLLVAARSRTDGKPPGAP